MIIRSEKLAMNPNSGDIPLSQDFSLPHQSLGYNTQVAEVASPIVSSTSHPETDGSPNLAMVQMRGGTCTPRQTDNIGSIITMLIDDQNVDIDSILTEEQYRQESQIPEHQRIQAQHDIQAKIKEELPLSAQLDYSYPGPEYTFHMREFRPNTDWDGLDHSGLEDGHDGHREQHQQRGGDLLKQSLVSVPSVSQDRGGRDEKYWERRRKNNLAAKKSRDTRRVRENQLRLRVLFLENANKVLREQMERKDLEIGDMRERLRGYEKDRNCQISQ